MAALRRGAWWRWSVVAAAIALLASLPALIAARPVSVRPISAAQLYERIMSSANVAYHGFALANGTAGLPSLSQLSDSIDLLNSETQLRVWYAGPQSWRVDQIGPGTERDVYQLVDSQLIWDFGEDRQTQIVTGDLIFSFGPDPSGSGQALVFRGRIGPEPVRLPRAADLVPPDLARRILVAVGPKSGTLSLLPARRVAGLAAAGIRLVPNDSRSTVGHIDIWADPTTGLPLQLELTGKGADQPVLVTRFLDVALTAPDPAVLVPPAVAPGMGMTVTSSSDVESAFHSLGLGPLPDSLDGLARSGNAADELGIGFYGTGFIQYVVLPVTRGVGTDATNQAGRAGGLRVTLPHGDGVLLSSPLLSVLVMQSYPARRSYILIGLVSGDVLRAAGADLSGFVGRVRR